MVRNKQSGKPIPNATINVYEALEKQYPPLAHEEIEIFLSEHCGYHLSEINWMVMKGDVVFLNENDF